MIHFYYDTSSYSSQKAAEWFRENSIAPFMKRIGDITREDLMHILHLTDKGIVEIYKRTVLLNFETKELVYKIENMKLRESIDLLTKHTELLRVPIIFDEHKLLIGYNPNEIRKFIPKSYRRIQKSR